MAAMMPSLQLDGRDRPEPIALAGDDVANVESEKDERPKMIGIVAAPGDDGFSFLFYLEVAQ